MSPLLVVFSLQVHIAIEHVNGVLPYDTRNVSGFIDFANLPRKQTNKQNPKKLV